MNDEIEKPRSSGRGAVTTDTTLARENADLMPCPFCGGEACPTEGRHGDGRPWPYIECLGCGAMAEPEKWNERTALRSTAAGSVDEARALVQWIIDNSGAHPANISAVAQKAIAALSQVSGRDAVVEELGIRTDGLRNSKNCTSGQAPRSLQGKSSRSLSRLI